MSLSGTQLFIQLFFTLVGSYVLFGPQTGMISSDLVYIAILTIPP